MAKGKKAAFHPSQRGKVQGELKKKHARDFHPKGKAAEGEKKEHQGSQCQRVEGGAGKSALLEVKCSDSDQEKRLIFTRSLRKRFSESKCASEGGNNQHI